MLDFSPQDIAHTLYLLGDTGLPHTDRPDALFSFLKAKLKVASSNTTVVFLGDNIYPNGLPAPDDAGYSRAKERLEIQLSSVRNFPGKVYFTSGNHDWNKGKKDGLEFVLRQENYLEESLGRGNTFLPDDGLPGPVEVRPTPEISLIFVNTQWWVQKGEIPFYPEHPSRAATEKEFFKRLHKLLEAPGPAVRLVLAHHPLYSKAEHGGYFKLKDHIFPLRYVHKKLYVPLPLAGSLYPMYRRYIGAKEDISYRPYKRMRNKLLQVLEHFPGLIYASGHDHNLQYIQRHQLHFLISGSGSKSAYVKDSETAEFVSNKRGFMRLLFLKTGETLLEAWNVDEMHPLGKCLFSSPLGNVTYGKTQVNFPKP